MMAIGEEVLGLEENVTSISLALGTAVMDGSTEVVEVTVHRRLHAAL